MFELPKGEPVDGEMNLNVETNVFSFDFGAVSYFKPRAKNPFGHRLICAGESAGWICDADKGKKFLAGEAAQV